MVLSSFGGGLFERASRDSIASGGAFVFGAVVACEPVCDGYMFSLWYVFALRVKC